MNCLTVRALGYQFFFVLGHGTLPTIYLLMKKLMIMAVVAALSLSTAVFAQDKMQADKMSKEKKMSMKSDKMKMKDGKMMDGKMKDGKMMDSKMKKGKMMKDSTK